MSYYEALTSSRYQSTHTNIGSINFTRYESHYVKLLPFTLMWMQFCDNYTRGKQCVTPHSKCSLIEQIKFLNREQAMMLVTPVLYIFTIRKYEFHYWELSYTTHHISAVNGDSIEFLCLKWAKHTQSSAARFYYHGISYFRVSQSTRHSKFSLNLP